ncbi:hypothetical protein [Enterococcus lactis]|uniref:hypothetical protein n=1 Tax=Enterococcus lactis TaxID=357441 RepID=UPI004043385A
MNGFAPITTDYVAPFHGLKATSNGDGDCQAVDVAQHYVGGWHGYLNDSSASAENTPTAQTIGLQVLADNHPLEEDHVYPANEVKLIVLNEVQGINTKKARFFGIDALYFIQHDEFDFIGWVHVVFF